MSFAMLVLVLVIGMVESGKAYVDAIELPSKTAKPIDATIVPIFEIAVENRWIGVVGNLPTSVYLSGDCDSDTKHVAIGVCIQRDIYLPSLSRLQRELSEGIFILINRRRGKQPLYSSYAERLDGKIAFRYFCLASANVCNYASYPPFAAVSLPRNVAGRYHKNVLNTQPWSLHRDQRVFSDLRLTPDRISRQSAYDNEKPIGPFNGVIPFWCFWYLCFSQFAAFWIISRCNRRFGFPLAYVVGLNAIPVWFYRRLQYEKQHEKTDAHRRITITQKYLTIFNYCNTVIRMANVLSRDKQIAVI